MIDLIASRPPSLLAVCIWTIMPLSNIQVIMNNLNPVSNRGFNSFTRITDTPSTIFEYIQKYSLLISISNSSLKSNAVLTEAVEASTSSLGMETYLNGFTLAFQVSRMQYITP